MIAQKNVSCRIALCVIARSRHLHLHLVRTCPGASAGMSFERTKSESLDTIELNRGNIKSFSGRLFLLTLLVFSMGCQPRVDLSIPASTTPSSHVTILGQREYLVHQQLTLVNEGSGQPEKQNLWVALIRDFSPYQQVKSMEVSPKNYTLVVDELGNHYAEFDFSKQPGGTTQMIKIDYRVDVNELAYDLSACQGELPDEFNQPELHIEFANPQITALASKLSQGKGTVCQKVRAFYDYIGDNLVYTYNGANWGAQATLGPMGADCTEYSDLLAALSPRARHSGALFRRIVVSGFGDECPRQN